MTKEEEQREKRKISRKRWQTAPENKEKIREYERKSKAKNKEKIAVRAKIYRDANKEKMHVKAKEYRENNKEIIAKRKKEYQQTDNYKKYQQSDICKEVRKRYYKENREKCCETQKKWRVTNKKQLKTYRKEYGQTLNGRLRIAAGKARRRALDINAKGSYTVKAIKNLYVIQGARCYYCSVSIEDKYEIDHMNPLIRGGSNWIDNICLACVRCNRSKHTKTAEEFIACSLI